MPVWAALVAWTVAGFGIGIAYSPISLTALGWARPGNEGRVSASVQLCDVLGTALGTGVAGAAVAIVHQHGGAARLGLGLAFATAAGVACWAWPSRPGCPSGRRPIAEETLASVDDARRPGAVGKIPADDRGWPDLDE